MLRLIVDIKLITWRFLFFKMLLIKRFHNINTYEIPSKSFTQKSDIFPSEDDMKQKS